MVATAKVRLDERTGGRADERWVGEEKLPADFAWRLVLLIERLQVREVLQERLEVPHA
jgi:hypothetical protein